MLTEHYQGSTLIISFPKRLNALGLQGSDCGERVLKVNRKYSTVLTALFMTLCMNTTMTFTMTLITVGLSPALPARFLGGFAIGFAVGFPTSLLVIPNIRKLVNRLTGG